MPAVHLKLTVYICSCSTISPGAFVNFIPGHELTSYPSAPDNLKGAPFTCRSTLVGLQLFQATDSQLCSVLQCSTLTNVNRVFRALT